MTKKTISLSVVTLAVIVAVILYLFLPASGPQTGPEVAVRLPVWTLKAETVNVVRSFPTTIEGEMDVEIRPQVEGYLAEMCVKEGDYVAQGALLFRIDDALYREDFHAAEANLAASEAHLDRAAIDLERNKNLLNSRVISETQYRTVVANHKEAQALVMQNRAAMERARIRLHYTRLEAPVSGLVGRLPYRKGSFIAPSNVEPLTLLSAVDKVRARLSLSERDYLPFVQEYQKKEGQASLILVDGSCYPHTGTLSAINGSFDRNTGAVAVWFEFPNADRLLRSGNTGSLLINKQLENALLVPPKATFTRQDKTLVYLLDPENRVKSHVIETMGEAANGNVVVQGLKEGDRILLSGLNKVIEGTQIEVE